MSKGKFIIIDGIEGRGGDTQTNLLSEFLIKQGKEVIKYHYPTYDQPIGKVIYEFLNKKYDFSPEVQALLYFSEFLQDKEIVEKSVAEGKYVIADRYFSSTIAYQGTKGVNYEKLMKLAGIFPLAKPDLAIYLKLSPETSIKRKTLQKGRGELDRHEGNFEFLQKLAKIYDKIAEKSILCKWEIVDAEKSIEEVFNQIIKLI